jgi:hypothetical protein
MTLLCMNNRENSFYIIVGGVFSLESIFTKRKIDLFLRILKEGIKK